MRKTLLATASSALAAAALLVGAGTVGAQTCPEVIDAEQVDAGDRATVPCRGLAPVSAGEPGSDLGYGSLGTGSLMDLITMVINTGSTTLSLAVPNATGSYAPGSFGSYGPEASIGELIVGPIGSLGGLF